MFERDYLVFSVFLVAFVMLLLGTLGMAAGAAAAARVSDTAIGSALALARRGGGFGEGGEHGPVADDGDRKARKYRWACASA